MKLWSTTIGYSRNNPDPSYHIEIYEQPFHRWLVAALYHWYDMRIPIKVPGWNRFERLLRKLGAEEGEPRWIDKLLSWSVEQDFRCYDLGKKQRQVITRTEVDEATARSTPAFAWCFRDKP